MATHSTGIGPISSQVHLHHVGESEDEEVVVDAQLVAFTWTDEDPTEPTGYWYIGKDFVDGGLVWVSADATVGPEQ